MNYWETHLARSPLERYHLLAESDTATASLIADRVAAYKRKIKAEHIDLEPIVPQATQSGSEAPPETVSDSEIEELIAGLYELRATCDFSQFRVPLFEGYDADLCAAHGISTYKFQEHKDPCPQNRGERLLALMRKYWLLAFGYAQHTQGTSKKDIHVTGLAQIIFDADFRKIDQVDVKLCLGDFSGKTITEAARLILGRTGSEEKIKQLAEKIKKRVQRWGSHKKRLRGHK